MYPTLAEVLDLPVLRAAAPRVRAGSAGLDARVRWVHVSEQRNPAGTLSGGELVLSIGVAVADPTTDPAAYVAALRDAGAAGLAIELGQHLRSLPAALVQAARAEGFPLIELTRTVRFVEITEIVHARILNSQYARMQFTQQVHDTFRTLTVEGGGVEAVLTRAAELTGLPVVLEDLGHRALSFAGDLPAATLLKDWTARSRQAPLTPMSLAGPEGWMTSPVGPRNRRWGRLVVPRRVTGDDAAEEVVEQVAMVLRHAADALTIGRLLGDDSLGLELEAQGELLQDLLRSTTLDEPALRARARALGLPSGGVLTAVVVRGRGDDRELIEAAAAAARTVRAPAIVGRLAADRVALVVSCRSRESEPGVVERIVGLLPVAVAGAAEPVATFSDLAAALAEAAFVVDVAATAESPTDARIRRAADLGAQGLLWQLRTDPRLSAYVDAQLGPLLRLDEPARGRMLETLTAYLGAGGAMTAFAAAVNLSRPAAYARLAKLRTLLARDLDQPGVRLSLHLAVLAVRQAGETALPGARQTWVPSLKPRGAAPTSSGRV